MATGGMVKSLGKQAFKDAELRYITALTDPQIRRMLAEGTLQLDLFHEKVCEVEADGVRYVLRKNESEAARKSVRHRRTSWPNLQERSSGVTGRLRHPCAVSRKPDPDNCRLG